MKRKNCFSSLLFVFLFTLGGALFSLNGAERPVRVGFFAFPGFHEKNRAGENSGYGYEYLQRLAMYNGWVYEYVGYEKSWADMLQMLQEGKIDLLATATRSPERMEKFLFSASSIGRSYTLFTVRAGEERYLPGDYANWNGIRVGMLKGNSRNESFRRFAEKKAFSFVPVYLADSSALQEALQDGTVDGLVTGSLRKHSGEWVYEKFDPKPFYFITRKGNEAFLKRLDHALTMLTQEFPELEHELNAKYYSFSNRDSIPFTVEERQFIQDAQTGKKVFYALINPDRPPFSYYSGDRIQGLMRILLDKMIARTGLDIRVKNICRRSEYCEKISGNDFKLILDAWYDFPNAERNRVYLTRPYMSITVSSLQRKNLLRPPVSVALIRNSDIEAKFRRYDTTGATPVFYDTTEEVIHAVKSGRQEAGYLYTQTAENVIASDDKRELSVRQLRNFSTSYAVGVGYGADPRLIAILDKAVRSIPEAEISDLLSKHCSAAQNDFSLIGWCYSNPRKSIGGAFLLLCIVIGILLTTLIRRHKAWQRAKIIEQLPLRYFVFDRKENILIYSSANMPELRSRKTGFHLSDFMDSDVADLMRRGMEKIHSSGESQTFDFQYCGQGRSATLSRLPDMLFGRETYIWISQDTTELQNTREDARRLAERFRLTLNSIGDGVLVTDADEKVTLLNPVAERLTGWSHEEAQGKPNEKVFHIVSALDGSGVASPIRRTLQSGSPVELANHTDLISRDGKRYHIADSSAPIHDADGRMIGAILVFRDVTDAYETRDRLNAALRKSDELNVKLQDMLTWQNVLLESMPVYIYAMDCDNDFRYTFSNSYFAALFNISQNDIVGKTDWELWGEAHPDLSRMVMETLRKVPEDNTVREDVLPFPDRNGCTRIGRFFRKRETLSGNRHWVFGMMVDITDKEEALHKMREANEWFHLTLNSIGDGVITTDADGNIVMMNPVAERMSGIRQINAVGQPHENVFRIVSSLDDLPMTSPVRRSLRTGSVVELANHTELISLDGRRYHIADSAAPIRNHEGVIIGAILVFRDVSEEYASRDRLRAALTGLEYAAKLSRAAYFKIRIKDRFIVSASKVYEELWPVKDGYALPPEEAVHPEDLSSFLRSSDELLMGKCDSNVWTFRTNSKDGVRHLRVMAGLDETGSADSYFVGVLQDVTDLTRSERELNSTMTLLKLILDSLPVMIFAKDAADDFRYTLSNRSFDAFSGLLREQLIGRNDLEIFKRKDLAELYRKQDESVIASGKSLEFTDSFYDASGKICHLRTTKIPFLSEDGRRWLLGVSIDLTKELEQRNQLNSLLSVFELASKMTNSVAFHINPETRSVTGSRRFTELWPVRDGKAVPREYVVHPEDLSVFSQAYDALHTGKLQTAKVDFRCIYYGDVRYYKLQFERKMEHKVPILSGILQNVTESQQTSSLLHEAMRQDSFFHMVLSQIPCQVFIKDAMDDFRYKVANKNFTDYYQLRVDQVIEHTDFEFFDPAVAAQLRAHDTEVCAAPGRVFHFDEDISFQRAGKEIFKSMKVCFETSDHHSYLLGICVDVTEVVRSTENLQNVERLWKMIIDALPVNIFAKNADDNFRYTIANRGFADFVGRTVEQIIGRTDAEIIPNPEDAELFKEKDRQVMASDSSISFTESPSDCHGQVHQLRTVKLPTMGPEGRRLLVGISLDVTELENRIRMEELNSEVLSQTVAEPDFRKVIDKIAGTMIKTLHCSHVLFAEYFPEKGLKLFHEGYVPGQHSVLDTGLSSHEELWNAHRTRLLNNEMILYPDFRRIPGIEDLLRKYPEYPTRSLAAVPVFIGTELIGALLVSYTEPHAFEEMEQTLLRAMGNVIALAAIRERQALRMKQSEQENQALLDNISIPLWLFDASGRIIKTNKASARLLGEMDPEMPPYACKKVLACLKTEDACPVRQVLAEGKTFRSKHLVAGRYYMVESSPIMDESSGTVHGVVSSFYDVTELNAVLANSQVVNDCLANLVREGDMHQAIELSIREICAHVAASRCYILQFDTEHRTISSFIEYAVNGKESIMGTFRNFPYSAKPDWEERFKTQSLLSFSDILNSIEADGLESYDDFLRGHQVRSLYAQRIMPNGTFWGYLGLMYEEVPHELTRSEADFIGAIANCIELMLIRKQYQSKIFDALHRAEEADRAKSIFLASMSHEIRTPLNAVIGFSELLKDGTQPRETELEYLKAISDSGNALLALINDVLDLSKLEAGQMVFSPTEVNFRDLSGEMSGIFHQKCQEKKLAFITEIAAGMPLVSVDKLRVRQILFNLIGNAVKFTDSGSITLRGVFSPDNDRTGTLEFHVIDTGVGISAEDQKRIFQMFVQSNALRGTQAEHNGTGLGLAICKRMIEKMDGELRVASQTGKGSDFCVILRHVAYRAAEKGMSSSSRPEEKDKMKSLPKCTVMIADDVAMNLKVMSAMLKKLGADVVTASNADDVWRLLPEKRVDCLLTDLWMPGMNGAELAMKIRRSGKFADLRIAAVTADAESGDNFNMSVFDAVLTKPITVEKLHAFLSTVKHC